tara:strand:+ start:4081 stop:4365 length:285 start_codon:yes stop_codon:yes gene_type:complete
MKPDKNVDWRRGRDSNPGYCYQHNGFRDRPIRPLWHLSAIRAGRWGPVEGGKLAEAPGGRKRLGIPGHGIVLMADSWAHMLAVAPPPPLSKQVA